MRASLICMSLGLAALSGSASAQVTVSDGWIRATPVGAPTAAAYLTVTNRGAKPERLLGGATSVAAHLGVHAMSMTGGIMRMRELAQGLPIPPGATVALKPGGDHLMLTGLKRPLRPGDRADVVLRFEQAGETRVTLPVRGR